MSLPLGQDDFDEEHTNQVMFILFLSMTIPCILIVPVILYLTMVQRWKDLECCRFVNMYICMQIATGVVVLIIMASIQDPHGLGNFYLCLFVWFFLFGVCLGLVDPDCQLELLIKIAPFLSAFLVVPGLVLITASYKHAWIYHKTYNDNYYYGPMRITGYSTLQERVVDPNTQALSYKTYGGVKVSFGLDWACPLVSNNNNNVWCDSVLAIENDCTVNSKRLSDKDKVTVEDCVKARYNLSQWSERINFDHAEFDVQENPALDENWPFGNFSGFCNRCEATVDDQRGLRVERAAYAKHLQLAGIILSTPGVILSLVRFLFLWIGNRRMDVGIKRVV